MKSIILFTIALLLPTLLFAQSSVEDIQNWASRQNTKITSNDVAEFFNGSRACNEIVYGDDAYFDILPTEMPDITCLDSNRFVVVYREPEGDERGFVVVGNITGMDVSFGPRFLMDPEQIIWPRISTLDSNRIIFSYGHGTGFGYDYQAIARIGEVIGDSIALGVEFPYIENMFWCVTHHYEVEALNPELFVISYFNYHMPYYSSSILGRIYNDSISFSQEYSFAFLTPVGNELLGKRVMTKIDTNKFVVSYSNCDTAYYSASRLGTILGDSIAFGPECKFQSGVAIRMESITLDSSTIINAYVDKSNEEKGELVKGTLSGDSIIFSKQYVFYPDWTTYVCAATLDENRFIVTCWDWVDQLHHGTACYGEIVGDTILFGPFNAYSPDYCFFPEAASVDSERFIIVYTGVGLDYLGTAVIGRISNEKIITSLDSIKSCPGDIVSTVMVQDMSDINNFSISFAYDTNYLAFSDTLEVHPLLQNDTLFVTDGAGKVTLFWESSSGISIEDDTLCKLGFNAFPQSIRTTQFLTWDTSSYYIDTNGFYAECEYLDGMIIIDSVPEQPQTPYGLQSINLNQIDTSEYTIPTISGADYYYWHLLPSEAGSISGSDTLGVVTWDTTYSGLQAFIFVSAFNECGESMSDSLVISISPVGITQAIMKMPDFRIAPNPSNGTFTLYINNTISTFDLSVFNLRGETIFNQNINALADQIQIDLSHLKSGTYLLRIHNDEMNYSERIIIIN